MIELFAGRECMFNILVNLGKLISWEVVLIYILSNSFLDCLFSLNILTTGNDQSFKFLLI